MPEVQKHRRGAGLEQRTLDQSKDLCNPLHDDKQQETHRSGRGFRGSGQRISVSFETADDPCFQEQKNGGAGRDRTDDFKLAKLALSQLSYGPV